MSLKIDRPTFCSAAAAVGVSYLPMGMQRGLRIRWDSPDIKLKLLKNSLVGAYQLDCA